MRLVSSRKKNDLLSCFVITFEIDFAELTKGSPSGTMGYDHKWEIAKGMVENSRCDVCEGGWVGVGGLFDSKGLSAEKNP